MIIKMPYLLHMKDCIFLHGKMVSDFTALHVQKRAGGGGGGDIVVGNVDKQVWKKDFFTNLDPKCSLQSIEE